MVDIRVALASILSPKVLAIQKLDHLITLATKMGYNGFEVQPPRSIFPIGFQLRFALPNPDKYFIKSLHQSYRSERWPWQWMFHQRKKDFLKAYLLFNYRLDSPKDLRRIMRNLGHEVPIVLYPSHAGEKPVTSFGFQEMLVQPSESDLKRYFILSPQDLNKHIKTRGFHGYALDTAHIQACQRYFLVPMKFLIRSLFPNIHEVHISLSREIGDDQETFRILEILKDYGYHGPYVVETPPNSDIDFHKKIVNHLNKILN